LLPFGAQLLAAILSCLSNEVQGVKELSTKANSRLHGLITDTKHQFSIGDILNTVTFQFLNQYVPTRLAALNWILLLHSKTPTQLLSFVDELFPALFKTLSDVSDQVVRLDLEVMAKISLLDDAYFIKLMNILVDLFSTDRHLLENRGTLIIRELALFISPEKIYLTAATILETEEDTEFATVMVQTLNLILLTAPELSELRSTLKNLALTKGHESHPMPPALQHANTNKNQKENPAVILFSTLYRSWSHNPTATLSLCLLSQLYQHATDLIFKFGELQVTVNFLLEMDKLVQLLESSIFLYLRLQLLEPERYPYLFKCLYGILMLLPQSSAFETLRNRLNSVTSLGVLQLIPKKSAPSVTESSLGINFDELLVHFQNIQIRHTAYRQRKVATLSTPTPKGDN